MPPMIAAGVVKGHPRGNSHLLMMVMCSPVSDNPVKYLPSITQVRKGCRTEMSLGQQMLGVLVLPKPPVPSQMALTDGIGCMSSCRGSGIS